MTSFIEILKSVFFGIVEGVTEWLPISSTGHLILLDEFISFNLREGFWDMFSVVIQLGAIIAVVVMFWKKLFPFGADNKKLTVKMPIIRMWLKIAVACIPAGVIGILFDDVFDKYFYNPLSVAAALIVFGVLFIVIEKRNKNRQPKITSIDAISYKAAIIIGVFQLLAAVFPGTSRSGATILGAILIGISRTAAAEFTFFLAVPTMLGASLVKLLDFGFSFTGLELAVLLVGMAVSFAVSIAVIKFLLSYIKKHNFTAFGVYRIILGIAVIIYFAIAKK